MDVTMLETGKVDITTFKRIVKRIDMKDLEQDIKLFKNANHCVTLDNYMEKYLPIRSQNLIDETLRSVLSGKERRRKEEAVCPPSISPKHATTIDHVDSS